MNLYVGEQTWAFARLAGNEVIVVVFNNSRSPEKVEFDSLQANLEDGTEFEDRLGGMRPVKIEGGKIQLNMPARSAAILARKN